MNKLNVPAIPPVGADPATGEEVEITINFRLPIILPQGHYFFRPEVLLTSGDFLFPDWLRIGTDIIGGGTSAHI